MGHNNESHEEQGKPSFIERVFEGVLIAVIAGLIVSYITSHYSLFTNGDDNSTIFAKTEGISNASTEIKNIQYNEAGRIVSLSENLDNSWVDWTYFYDANNNFNYRCANIGAVNSTLSSEHMPGTDVSYSVLERPIYNCVGFTLDYQLTKVWSGDGLGDRNVYIYNGHNWKKIATFSYEDYDLVHIPITLDQPTVIEKFTTPRINEDDYTAFMISQNIRDVIIIDYNNVVLK